MGISFLRDQADISKETPRVFKSPKEWVLRAPVGPVRQFAD